MYNSNRTKEIMCESILLCIENYIEAVCEEMIASRKVFSDNFSLNKEMANSIYDNLLYQKKAMEGTSENNPAYIDFLSEKSVQCIQCFPFRSEYYMLAMQEFMRSDKAARANNGYGLAAFLKFWNIEFIFTNYENAMKNETRVSEELDELGLSQYIGKYTAESYYFVKKIYLKVINENTSKNGLYMSKFKEWFDKFKSVAPSEISKYPVLTWVSNQKSNIQFIEELRQDRIHGARALNHIWMNGDINTKYKAPPASLYKKIKKELQDDHILLLADDSMNMGLCGMALSDNYIIDLWKFKYIRIDDVISIDGDKNYLYVKSLDSTLKLYIKGLVLDDIEGDEKFYEMEYYKNLLKLYCYRYGNNTNVYEAAMQPIDD